MRRTLPCSYAPDGPPGTGRGRRSNAAATTTNAANNRTTANGNGIANRASNNNTPPAGVSSNGSQQQPQVQPQLTVEPPTQQQQFVGSDPNAVAPGPVDQSQAMYGSDGTNKSGSGSPPGSGSRGTRGAKRSLPPTASGNVNDTARGRNGKRVRVDKDERDREEEEQTPARLVDVRAGA